MCLSPPRRSREGQISHIFPSLRGLIIKEIAGLVRSKPKVGVFHSKAVVLTNTLLG
jgi:hypothetical protein